MNQKNTGAKNETLTVAIAPARSKRVGVFVKLAIAVVSASLLTGCVRYQHVRKVSTPAGGLATNVVESTSITSLFKKGESSLVESSVTDGGYTRTVGAKNIKTSGDDKSINATGGAAGEIGKTILMPH